MWSFSCAARTLINLEVRPNQCIHCRAGCISSLWPSFLWNKLSSHLETQTKHVPELAPMLVPERLGENWLLIADLKRELTTKLDLENNCWSSRVMVRFLQSADLKWDLLICSSRTVPKKLGATMTFTLCSLSYTSSNAVSDYSFGTQETSLTLH